MDLSGIYQQKIDDALATADLHEKNSNFTEASRLYEIIAQTYVDFARNTEAGNLKHRRSDMARRFLEKSKIVRNKKIPGRNISQESCELGYRKGNRSVSVEIDKQSITKQVNAMITKANVDWDDIAGLDYVKSDLKSLFGIKLAKAPKNVVIEQNPNILFYGPTGTGKTMLASAVSKNLEATFFNVRTADIVSKWMGESSKLVSMLFEVARQNAPSVIFIDEFDSLVGSREFSTNQSDIRILGSLLSEIDGLQTKQSSNKFVIVIAATNTPWDLDKATLSRFSGGQIYIPLPNQSARESIIRLNIHDRGFESEISSFDLAATLEGYSGREINAICNNAVKMMIKRLNKELDSVVDQGLTAISNYNLIIGTIEKSEFNDAIKRTQCQVSVDDIRKFENWM